MGSSTITLSPSDTISTLLSHITEKTTLTNFDIKYGYPPRSLSLSAHPATTPLSDLSPNLDGEQLIVSDAASPPPPQTSKDPSPPPPRTDPAPSSNTIPRAPTASANDAPELPLPAHASTMILRIMPDDNSCLFRALGTILLSTVSSATELRSLVAQTIQANPTTYTAAVLDNKAPDAYCRWITSPASWGGGIELAILSEHFDIEVCSIDVQTLRVDRFNEGARTRCVVVYSGIHYDAIASSPSEPPHAVATAPPEWDVKVFDAADEAVLETALELCRVLQGRHYYTDTAGFSVRCEACGATFKGEKGAQEHAAETGHYEFGEAG
ncbi:MAG: ubiquitin-specific protease otu1 [Piccolia ochrophora]|nr:MAG: ubiquitin-specific protease otu1 [Piccolia ochrophora]